MCTTIYLLALCNVVFGYQDDKWSIYKQQYYKSNTIFKWLENYNLFIIEVV